MVRIHNLATDEITDRQMDDVEYAQHQTDVAAAKAKVSAEANAQAAKESAQDKLAALGLTTDDLKALGL